MAFSITKDYLEGLPQDPYRHGFGEYEGVVNHATATPEASAKRETEYFKENWKKRRAFAHFFVDWDSIIQHASTKYKAWGAGNGNPRYVHVELCETKDPEKFAKSYERYVWLVAKLLADKKLGVKDGETCVSHAWVSEHLGGTDHQDPLSYLKSHGVSWAKHISNVKKEYDRQVAPAKKPVKTAPVKSEKVVKKYTSLVDYLNDHKQPSDFQSRYALAEKHGIHSYSGSAEQNLKLLEKLQK